MLAQSQRILENEKQIGFVTKSTQIRMPHHHPVQREQAIELLIAGQRPLMVAELQYTYYSTLAKTFRRQQTAHQIDKR